MDGVVNAASLVLAAAGGAGLSLGLLGLAGSATSTARVAS